MGAIQKEELSIQDKIRLIGFNNIDVTNLDEQTINILFENREQLKDKPVNLPKEEPKRKVDETSDKYIFLLKFVNKILTNIGKNEIGDLLEFKDIDREEIIKDCNTGLVDEMEKELFKLFERRPMGWYRKNHVDHYILTILRCMCKDIGLSFCCKEKREQHNRKIKGKMYYSIIY